MAQLKWVHGKYGYEHGKAGELTFFSIGWPLSRSATEKEFQAELVVDLPGKRQHGGYFKTRDEAKAEAQNIWDKWLERVSTS